MFIVDEIKIPHLAYTGLDGDLTEEERSFQETLHKFARDVMRPIGEQLDKMTAEDVCADGSPLFDYLAQFKELGITPDGLLEMEPQQQARMVPLMQEELGWGDAGLALLPMVQEFASFAASKTGISELSERFNGMPGCWLATQPDRGGDLLDIQGTEIYPGSRHEKGNLMARVDGDIILNGSSSAWVSGAPISKCALAYVPTDFGDGIYRNDGTLRGSVILVPFDEPGVSLGKPLDKMGQRPLPQGEVIFDNVRLPKNYMITDDAAYNENFFGVLTWANMEMAGTFTGLARAAYEHALAYVHERRQGGTELINHQSVRLRIYELWELVEVARAVTRRAANFNFLAPDPHILASITAKVRATENSYEAAHKALQLFGGNGMTREYPMEKLLRDARAALIEDGENTVLSLTAASHLSDHYKQHGAA
jgi:acyl-CoA dehydrogenase